MDFVLEHTHEEWRPLLKQAFEEMAPDYLKLLKTSSDWLPKLPSLLAAFSMPLSSTRYILLGESPYPRAESANGYAFWDANVQSIWSPTGLSKPVNRATSLRNLIKMLLIARGDLSIDDYSKAAIATLNHHPYVQTGSEFFTGFINRGFLLLNASLVYSEGKVPYHAKYWRPFIHSLLLQLHKLKLPIELILFGKIAAQIPEANLFPSVFAEHPYNISFITNPKVIAFFQPLDLLMPS